MHQGILCALIFREKNKWRPGTNTDTKAFRVTITPFVVPESYKLYVVFKNHSGYNNWATRYQ